MADYLGQFSTEVSEENEAPEREQETATEDSSSLSDIDWHDVDSIRQHLDLDRRKTSKMMVKPRPKSTQLQDEDYLICPARLHAYLLDHKVWVSAMVSGLENIKWYSEPFSYLELNNEKKRLVKALVESFDTESPFEGFDDVVQGKGKGLIFLFHGLPGLGKTMTAGKYWGQRLKSGNDSE